MLLPSVPVTDVLGDVEFDAVNDRAVSIFLLFNGVVNPLILLVPIPSVPVTDVFNDLAFVSFETNANDLITVMERF